MLKKAGKKLFPLHTGRGKAVKKAAVRLKLARPFAFDADYQDWIEKHELNTFLTPLTNQKPKVGEPLFSIVIPFFNTPDKYLEPLLDSIINQSFIDWELIMGDASTDDERSAVIKEQSQRDGRFIYHKINSNKGISNNTNAALKLAKGKYIVFSDHDDTLSPHALNEAAACLADDSTIDIFYSDEDKLSDDGKFRHGPFFKPDWSPHLFLQTNYTNHLSIIRRQLVEEVGGLRSDFDGSQDYDLLLRIHDLPKQIKVFHIPKIIYHWREADGSAAANFSHKSYASEAGCKALQEHIKRKKWRASAEVIAGTAGFYRVSFQPPENNKCLVLVAANSERRSNELIKDQLMASTDCAHVAPIFQAVSNASEAEKALENSTAQFAAVVTKALLPRQTDWLDRLCGVLELDDVLAVSPRVLDRHEKVLDMGAVKSNGQYINLLQGYPANAMTMNGHAEWIHDVDAPSGRLFAMDAKDMKVFLSSSLSGYASFCEKINKQSQSDARYCVTWSHVTVKTSGAPTGDAAFFNPNLTIDYKHKIKLRF